MMSFKIVPDEGEPYTVEAGSRDVLTWERTSKKGAKWTDLVTEMPMDGLYRLAWIASRRLKLYRGELSEFESEVELATYEEEPAVPTSGEASVET